MRDFAAYTEPLRQLTRIDPDPRVQSRLSGNLLLGRRKEHRPNRALPGIIVPQVASSRSRNRQQSRPQPAHSNLTENPGSNSDEPGPPRLGRDPSLAHGRRIAFPKLATYSSSRAELPSFLAFGQ
jgi:hypothetical protein